LYFAAFASNALSASARSLACWSGFRLAHAFFDTASMS
jgi:hypothetical protein